MNCADTTINDVLISREVDLPLLATLYESECFAFVVDRFGLSADIFHEMKEMTLHKITKAAKMCLGEATTTEVCGSFSKKTNISGSDIDIYVDTVDPVSEQKKKDLTDLLKTVFDDKHVSLGKKSITVFNGFFDVDVVCSNTVQFGVLPRADSTIAANCPANLAIRALKFVIKHERSDKVPGHLLEKFVQFVQSSYPIRNPLGGGGFQLFISILQHVVDCSPSKIVGLPGGTGATANIHRIAVTLVHQYVVGRTLNTTFRSNAEIFGWLNLVHDNDAVETAVGIVPSWLLSLDGMPSPSSPSIAVFQQYSSSGIRTDGRPEGPVPNLLNLMQHRPIAKYTLKGKIELEDINLDDEMRTLQMLARQISIRNPQLDIASRINQLKENGNEEFKKGQFRAAIYCYTNALEISSANVDLLNDRSAAYAKLRHFSRALEDAEAAQDLARDNIKSYFHIMTAALGKRKPLIALAAAGSALLIHPNEETILKLQLQAETMIAELSTLIAESTFQYDPNNYQSAPCWRSVLYKNRIFVVDEFGRTDYANIEDAVFEASNQYDGNGTTVLLLPGKYSTNQLTMVSNEEYILSIQIIGWSVDCKGTIIELSKPTQMNDKNCILSVVSGKCNVQISNCLLRQPFGVPIRAGHCAACSRGAVLVIEKCRLETPDSPCCTVEGENSVLEMNDCTVTKGSAVVVSAYDGLFRADRCNFKGCYRTAVEIRENGNADLTDCIFSECTAQAVSLDSKGKLLTMLRCKLTYCGTQNQHSAVLIETGKAILTECEICNCPGDAIVVQQRVNARQNQESDPQLIMKKCIIKKNKSGVCFHHGYGVIADNRINYNALAGLLVLLLSANRKVIVSGNTFLRNGVERAADFVVQGESLFDNGVILRNHNNFSVAPIIVSDKAASAARDKVLRLVHGGGM